MVLDLNSSAWFEKTGTIGLIFIIECCSIILVDRKELRNEQNGYTFYDEAQAMFKEPVNIIVQT